VEAFHLFKSEIGEEPEEVSKDFYKHYDKLKKEIKNPHAKSNKNTAEKKALSIAIDLLEETGDNYFKILSEVIELGGLPLVYMRKLRRVSKDTWQKDAKSLKNSISESYLKGILDISKSFNEETLDLIISEEFKK
jgi:hypothetical protein